MTAPGATRYLGDGEAIVTEVRRHPAVLLRTAVETAAIVAVAAFLGSALSPHSGGGVVDTLLGWITIVFALRGAWKVLEWWHDRVVVTDQRMFEVSGLLTRRVASMPLAHLTDLTYRRTPMGRVLGYGELVLETAGQHQALSRIGHLPSPDEFYRTLTSLVMARFPDAGPQTEEEVFAPEDDDTGPLPHVVL